MLKNKKLIKIAAILLITILIPYILLFIQDAMRYSNKKESLGIKNSILYVEIAKEKWNGEEDKIIIKDKEAVSELIEYLNSLELVQEEDYFSDELRSGKYITLYTAWNDITVTGRYIKVHDPYECDCCEGTKYYVVDSGFNILTGRSKVSKYINKLIDEYGEDWD
ncbi:hypothetical protein [Porcipelethomonas sp.]|uniref:hypothetical protein n=1 Tax=Porcipelethomonas sp. TaxID=2981675 RepID=UPI003EF79DFD